MLNQRRSAAGVLIGSAVLMLVLGSQASAAHAQPTCSPDIFGSEFAQQLALEVPDLVVTASVFDADSGCWYDLHPDVRLTTASAVKLQILATNLWQNQQRGTSMTSTHMGYAERMLWWSHNYPATTVLYANVGTSAMNAYGDAVGATQTTHSAIYGITRAPARDLTAVARSSLMDGQPGPLSEENRRAARELLAEVHPTQQWGISAGLPNGWTSLLKNGFFPCTNCGPFSGEYTWRVASTGVNLNSEDGRGYAISILTDGAHSQQEGIDAVEFVSRHVASLLTEGPEQDRPVDRGNCVVVVAGESRSSIVSRLGLTDAHWSEVLWTSGGEGPLSGQLMCGDEERAAIQQCICPARARRPR